MIIPNYIMLINHVIHIHVTVTPSKTGNITQQCIRYNNCYISYFEKGLDYENCGIDHCFMIVHVLWCWEDLWGLLNSGRRGRGLILAENRRPEGWIRQGLQLHDVLLSSVRSSPSSSCWKAVEPFMMQAPFKAPPPDRFRSSKYSCWFVIHLPG